jgi:hypothetical protein
LALYDPARHEPLRDIPWDAARARAAIERIVADAEARFAEERYWPAHPNDGDGPGPDYPLYMGACGVMWALHYLQSVGAVDLRRSYLPFVDPLIPAIAKWLGDSYGLHRASYLMGDTSVWMLSHALEPSPAKTERIAALIDANIDHPAREMLWGSPGTMLAAALMHELDGDARWGEAFRRNARHLESKLLWSPEYECHYWTQDMYRQTSSYTDAVHGFVATASVLIRGRTLLEPQEWQRWQERIANTISRTATREGSLANWRAWLYPAWQAGRAMLVQHCHGSPGFVTCLGDFPDASLDELLIAGGELAWVAGPLAKGANLCHGTAGNGYAFLKLYRRTGDSKWLDRARAFAMHAISQSESDEKQFGRMRYSLWTGDPGLAIYLWDCIHERAEFPSLDRFFA